MPLGRNLFLDLLARTTVTDVAIELAPTEVLFRQSSRAIHLRPFVFRDVSRARATILSVGGEPLAAPSYQRVEILDAGCVTDPPGLKYDCLEAFLTFGLIQVRRRNSILLCPLVHVRGMQQTSAAFAGYGSSILRHALLSAGARECVIH